MDCLCVLNTILGRRNVASPPKGDFPHGRRHVDRDNNALGRPGFL
jgi:hypothetical protein